MIAFLAIAAIAGLILGLRFNVLVLVPAILFTITVITLSDIARHQSFKMIVLTAVGSAVLLQIGYIAGRILRASSGAFARPGDDELSPLQLGS